MILRLQQKRFKDVLRRILRDGKQCLDGGRRYEGENDVESCMRRGLRKDRKKPYVTIENMVDRRGTSVLYQIYDMLDSFAKEA